MGFPAPIFEQVFGCARPFLQTRHNEIHTRVSWGFALQLLECEGGRAEVVIPAVVLHDVGWSRVPEDRQLTAFGPVVKDPELTKVHEREGAAIAEGILRALGYPEEHVRVIGEIIAGHDTRLECRGLEDALVKDADKLFRFSREGFPIDCDRFGLRPAAHLSWLDAQIDRWFFTATGKSLARAEVAARRRELALGEPAGGAPDPGGKQAGP